jgi:hypothetical protein
MAPVNVRSEGDSSAQGNRISFAFVELPLSEHSPSRRLERVHESMAELKSSGKIAGTDLLLRSTGTLPEPLKKRAAKLAASPRLYNLTISNVPGPRFSLYAAGARVRSIYPVIPIPEGHALSFGVLTYDKRVHFSAYVDPDALPRAGRLGILLEDALEELLAAASVRHLNGDRRGPARISQVRSGGVRNEAKAARAAEPNDEGEGTAVGPDPERADVPVAGAPQFLLVDRHPGLGRGDRAADRNGRPARNAGGT